jgi:hypothetical protein
VDSNGNALVWVVPNVLNNAECDEVIQLGEDHGYDPPLKVAGTLRTAKRTSQYQNKELSDRIFSKLHDVLGPKLDEDGMGDFYGLHANWRFVRYDEGDLFCAHQDQMDSMQVKNPSGAKDLIVSSHTLLINLSKDGVVKGGATRFYPNSKVKSVKSGQYNHTVDVWLPRGWALAFRQKGLIHAGQPVEGKLPKYVAQAGILRRPPRDYVLQPSVFRLGPRLEQFETNKVGFLSHSSVRRVL